MKERAMKQKQGIQRGYPDPQLYMPAMPPLGLPVHMLLLPPLCCCSKLALAPLRPCALRPCALAPLARVCWLAGWLAG